MARAEGAEDVPRGGSHRLGSAPTLARLSNMPRCYGPKCSLRASLECPIPLVCLSRNTLSGRGKLPGTRQTIDGDQPRKGTREAWPLGVGFCRKFSFEAICGMVSPFNPCSEGGERRWRSASKGRLLPISLRDI